MEGQIHTTRPIRSHKTGMMLPRTGTVVREMDNLGRHLILVRFETVEEYLFPDEIEAAEVGHA